ncbi:MAG TPA: hypothetical protein VIB39_02070 [Candidatus Angelobacter sp.]|jgi:hypothetical protein
MNDDQKWLEAAAGIEQDILYLRTAAAKDGGLLSFVNDIERLTIALAIYRKNAATGVAWPSPDDLFCIDSLSSPQHVSTATRRDFKLAS